MDFKVDRLKLYFGDPIKLDTFTIKQPTIQDIMDFGEHEAYQVANIFCGNTTSNRVSLWEMGIDWNKISDFELFCSFSHTLDSHGTNFLFEGDLDFSKFEPMIEQIGDSNEVNKFLYCKENGLKIDEDMYKKIREYIRTMFGIFPKDNFYKGSKIVKEEIIKADKLEYEINKKENTSDSTLLPLISACCNHSGFKYKIQELREVTIFQFMDSVRRLQMYEQSSAMLKGVYSGMVDMSKMSEQAKQELNFMRA